jgi:hypothetical protein
MTVDDARSLAALDHALRGLGSCTLVGAVL